MGDVLELFSILAILAGVPLLAYLAYALIQKYVVRGDLGDLDELRALRTRVAQLEQAVDVVAVEVERVGEAQRYTDRLIASPGNDSGSRARGAAAAPARG